jgi:hypothetical protein
MFDIVLWEQSNISSNECMRGEIEQEVQADLHSVNRLIFFIIPFFLLLEVWLL